MNDPLKIFVIAGEPSGDRLGAALIKDLKSLTQVQLEGVGGPLMEAEGLISQFPMEDLSVMGLVEIIPRIPKLLRRVRETAKAVLDQKPDVLVTIDSPDFCLRVAKKVKAEWPDVKIVHYVAPTVWAWRPERAEKMAKQVDHVLALFPFEPDYMRNAGMSSDFVGHPIISEPLPSRMMIDAAKGASTGKTRIAVLPGSRRGEVKRMLPLFGQVLRKLSEKHDLHVSIPTVRGSEADVKQISEAWGFAIDYIDQSSADDWDAQKQAAIAAADVALITSGTVTLEVAAVQSPQVVAYQANRATTRMVKKMALIDTANLINILTDTRDVPEFLFEAATPENLTAAIEALLTDPNKAAAQKRLAAKAIQFLTPSEDKPAARSVLRFLEGNTRSSP
ncbi:MAG: lipid-A-disaccharide synthase [Pseudomonadota bacterium]